MREQLTFCQDIVPDADAEFAGGFNSRIYGLSYNETNGYPNRPYNSSRIEGWNLADKLVNQGDVYYQHKFRHLSYSKICNGIPFEYGGMIVCNECGKARLNQPWWNIKVYKDGADWCVVGEGFVNLQESDNYAFGATKEDALLNYENLFLKQGK